MSSQMHAERSEGPVQDTDRRVLETVRSGKLLEARNDEIPGMSGAWDCALTQAKSF